MPNWTSNHICVKGEEADIRAFLEAVRSQDQIFDFHRIIPMPELLRRTSCGIRTIDGKDVSSWFVVKEGSRDTPAEVRMFTPEEQAQLDEIGYSNWHDWSVANWGTRSNACYPLVDAGTGRVIITFDTAWTAPVPILQEMIALFPKLTFDCRWQHEGEQWESHYLGDIDP